MRVGPASNVARINVAESITALWTFAHANGISLDDIIERTAAAGVTIDGLLVKDSGIPQAAVTAHEAALSLSVTQLAEVALIAFLNQAEAITALWEFTHASGLKTDVISERIAAAGVTVDGVLLQDKAVNLLGIAVAVNAVFFSGVTGDVFARWLVQADGMQLWGDGAAARDTNLYRALANVLATDDSFRVAGVLGLITDIITERTAAAGVTVEGLQLKDSSIRVDAAGSAGAVAYRSKVSGDADLRFRREIDGRHEWGDGTNPPDTTLYRSAADVLKTDDALHVVGVLAPLGDFHLASRTIDLASPTNDDVATGLVSVQRLAVAGAATTVSGFAGGSANRVIVALNVAAQVITLEHNGLGSVVENRMILPNNADIVMARGSAVTFWYDDTSSRWLVIANIN